MNQVVNDTWKQIDPGNDKVELDIMDVANFLFRKWGVTSDINEAIRQIHKATISKKMTVDFETFYAMFCTGFFRQAVVSCSKRLNAQKN